MKKVFEW